MMQYAFDNRSSGLCRFFFSLFFLVWLSGSHKYLLMFYSSEHLRSNEMIKRHDISKSRVSVMQSVGAKSRHRDRMEREAH
ncbi:uncharacterized protein F4812DRAFT_445709 [Daldinia caldariorum]|uniref:uncharacterized protein n=1 Tax=Daldinia caldariorum TaxID=326644 RepID=UPI0020075BCC|nr:uncharacterized protein F4812DRAFT_445709 [Daldinia caldariorum]KAI1463591.1 hypothetical protein F4812DRAFT_445709 [Daldinia caldariorum]